MSDKKKFGDKLREAIEMMQTPEGTFKHNQKNKIGERTRKALADRIAQLNQVVNGQTPPQGQSANTPQGQPNPGAAAPTGNQQPSAGQTPPPAAANARGNGSSSNGPAVAQPQNNVNESVAMTEFETLIQNEFKDPIDQINIITGLLKFYHQTTRKNESMLSYLGLDAENLTQLLIAIIQNSRQCRLERKEIEDWLKNEGEWSKKEAITVDFLFEKVFGLQLNKEYDTDALRKKLLALANSIEEFPGYVDFTKDKTCGNNLIMAMEEIPEGSVGNFVQWKEASKFFAPNEFQNIRFPVVPTPKKPVETEAEKLIRMMAEQMAQAMAGQRPAQAPQANPAAAPAAPAAQPAAAPAQAPANPNAPIEADKAGEWLVDFCAKLKRTDWTKKAVLYPKMVGWYPNIDLVTTLEVVQAQNYGKDEILEMLKTLFGLADQNQAAEKAAEIAQRIVQEGFDRIVI